MKKNIIYAIITFVVIIVIIMSVNFWIVRNVNTITGEKTDESTLKTLEEVVKEREIIKEKSRVKVFVNLYFEIIQKGEFEILKKIYFDNKDLISIVIGCGAPEDQARGLAILKDNERLKKIWQECSYFRGVRVEVLSINKINESKYEVKVAFFNKEGSPIKGNIGRTITVIKEEANEFKLRDWYFEGVSKIYK